ncbi:alpha/beta fold hydrolase [Jidongwangia harbinensis]|uniref:alpha/beta fold hydrolase n=1 Tax=Jidongwangia harbinensis TaxID=2878561 RepID=UPI001CDA3151|nr:alpha/beta fold hydrolase [Jidongwangia harbinensis]MCA2211599.1 alpha/beta fold hydrolase [Jidongwangia harbinensis]
MTDRDWRERRVEVQGRPVYVRIGPEVAGSVPFVHVHGFAVSGSYLMPTARALAGRATTLVPDLPGYGRSAAWGPALGIPSLAWALLDLLNALGLERVLLIGNSMGGPVSLEVAHSAPERVAGIVLASPAGGAHNQPFGRALLQLARDVFRESPRMLPVVLPDYLRFGPVNGLHLFSELARFPALERLLCTPVPTLAVLGGRDPLMPPRARVREISRLAPPHLTVTTIAGAAHAMNYSHPDDLGRVIGRWLDGGDLAGGPGAPGVAGRRPARPGDS